MEPSNILLSLNTATDLLTTVTIQDVMKLAKRPPSYLNAEFWIETANLLWNHLNFTFMNIDDQLLCSTSFYSVLIHTEHEGYFSQITDIIETEMVLRKTNRESKDTIVAVSLMYGLFQSSFLTNVKDYADNVEPFLIAANNLLIHMAYEYTQYTFIVFKTVKSYQKVRGTPLHKAIFNEVNEKHLLDVINNNWENPITGIRDMCKEIFQLLLSVIDETLLETVIKQVNGFYWNKAKFFIVAGIIKHKLLNSKDDLITRLNLNKGLFMSLHKPGLVSAGADMYFEVLKKIKSSNDWCYIFLQNTLDILTGSSRKAIENFNNYWYLATLKTFPDISQTLLQELQSKTFEVNCKLYSMLSLMKQSNKLGILEKNWDIKPNQGFEKYIIQGLVHCDTAIRILAFEIISVSTRKVVITNIECDLVIKYLQCNVNSDCAVLRQSMLNNLNSFLTRMYQYYHNENSDNLAMVTEFSHNLQRFIIESLNYDGNYQRKLTTVKIFQITVMHVTDTPKKKILDKKYTLERHACYLEYWLSSQEEIMASLSLLLNDPADDIRQTIGQVLLDQSDKIPDLMINELIEKATKDIKSKFFFDIDCALNKFKVIANILLTNVSKAQKWDLKNVDELLKWGFQCLIQSYEMRKSPVNAIFEGKQMHPYISIILIVLQVCQEKSYEINITQDTILRIVDILEYISRQFADQEEVGISTDFAQMNALVENFIVKSSHSSNGKTDGQTSGLHKLVLNSLWLNVKASCELAVFFIINSKEDINICNRCLKVITDVLETSRHKGAIEAAGFCLGQAIKHLSSIPGDSELPYELLKHKLQEWITEANKMASVTRRGAGMSIMVHRIVSSDMQKGKPLFHFFMKKLLKVCNSSNLMDNSETMDKDLPKAIFMHFLTKIVTDSSLAAYTLYYSTELAEIAFNNLTNGHWQIRNAALQLYGALVPKLIGQKKASGSDIESVATVAVDEFRTHFPKLWYFIKFQIIEHKINSLEGDSNLVPHLNLLASLAKKYNFNFEFDSDNTFLNGLLNMLGSPIFVVRRLTAQSIYKMYSYESINELLISKEIISQNQLHGTLLLVQNVCNEIKSNKENFEELYQKFNSIMSVRTHSYLNREIYETIFGVNDELENVAKELHLNTTSPGVYSWINTKVKILLSSGSWQKIHENIKMIFLLNDSEIYLDILYKRIETQDNIPKDEMLKIVTTLLSCKNKYDSFGLWKVLYSIALKVNLDCIDFQEIVQSVKTIDSNKQFLLPLIARSTDILAEDVVYFTAMGVSMIITQRNDDLKYTATIANNELAKNTKCFNEKTKLVIVINAVKFLQDENEDIRNESANFIKNIENTTYSLNPFICLQTILNKGFIERHFNQVEIAMKSLKVAFASEDIHVKSVDDNDPFAKETTNIYEEPNVIRKLVDNLNI